MNPVMRQNILTALNHKIPTASPDAPTLRSRVPRTKPHPPIRLPQPQELQENPRNRSKTLWSRSWRPRSSPHRVLLDGEADRIAERNDDPTKGTPSKLIGGGGSSSSGLETRRGPEKRAEGRDGRSLRSRDGVFRMNNRGVLVGCVGGSAVIITLLRPTAA